MSRAILEGGYVTRSRVLDATGTVLAVLPTWSDGAIVRAARPELTVQDGEWLGRLTSVPEPTHPSAAAFLLEVAS